MRKDCQHCLKNVRTFRLKTARPWQDIKDDNILLGKEQFESLKMIVNLSHLKHLDLTETPERDKSFLVWEILITVIINENLSKQIKIVI